MLRQELDERENNIHELCSIINNPNYQKIVYDNCLLDSFLLVKIIHVQKFENYMPVVWDKYGLVQYDQRVENPSNNGRISHMIP